MFTTTALLTQKYDSPSGKVAFLVFQPQDHFVFREGQFCMIEAVINGVVVRRAYSIATTYEQFRQEWTLGVIVKKVSEHGMSDFLTTKLSVGDTITLIGPAGQYVNPLIHKNYLFVSIWSGLSPNFWLFQHLIYTPHSYNTIVHLVWEKTTQDLVPQVTDTFKKYASPQVHTYFCLSQEQVVDPQYVHGRVQSKLTQARHLLPNYETTCFVCGIPTGVDEVVHTLLGRWVPKWHIIFEKY